MKPDLANSRVALSATNKFRFSKEPFTSSLRWRFLIGHFAGTRTLARFGSLVGPLFQLSSTKIAMVLSSSTVSAAAASLLALAFSNVAIQQAAAQNIVSYSPTTQSPAMSVCSKCGKIHGNSVSTMTPSGVPSSFGSPPSQFYPSSTVRPSSPLRSSVGGGISNVLTALNAQRSRQGLGALGYDPTLQAVARRRARLMASSGQKSHPPGSFAPGRYEGVGWNSSYSPAGVSACFTSDPNMRAAGAAMATGRDGVYFCVVYR